MKFCTKPTIVLGEEDKKALKEIHKIITEMPCSSLFCHQCPFNALCDCHDNNPEAFITSVENQLNEALIKKEG